MKKIIISLLMSFFIIATVIAKPGKQKIDFYNTLFESYRAINSSSVALLSGLKYQNPNDMPEYLKRVFISADKIKTGHQLINTYGKCFLFYDPEANAISKIEDYSIEWSTEYGKSTSEKETIENTIRFLETQKTTQNKEAVEELENYLKEGLAKVIQRLCYEYFEFVKYVDIADQKFADENAKTTIEFKNNKILEITKEDQKEYFNMFNSVRNEKYKEFLKSAIGHSYMFLECLHSDLQLPIAKEELKHKAK